MKLRIENFTFLLTFVVILLAGCSGGGQKTSPKIPIVSPNQLTPDGTSTPAGVKQNNETKTKPLGKTATLSAKQFSDLEYLATLKEIEYIEISRENAAGIPLPWDPIVVPIEWWKRRVEKGIELLIARRQDTITAEEVDKIALQYHREYGLVASMQLNIELRGSIGYRVKNLVNLAYAENPDDFDTLLLWVLAGGNLVDLYGEKKTTATRRLFEMNPDHPWVLHKLAKCLLGHNPQEALGYAQKAQELDARYRPLGAEGLCYFQMGDYKAALASFRRSHQYAVETSQPTYIIGAIGFWVSTAEIVVDSGGEGEDGREKKRKSGRPLLGPDLPTMLYR